MSSVTSALDIAAMRTGVRYIPVHEILARNGAGLAVPVSGTHLVPDQLFALEYNATYRAFVLEVDCGTEPLLSAAARKSLSSSLRLYQDAFIGDRFRQHYGLRATVLVLWVFTDRARAGFLLRELQKYPEAQRARHLVRVAEARVGVVQTDLFTGFWQRVELPAVAINA